jgi:chemotaxis protein methyltransferase CheR
MHSLRTRIREAAGLEPPDWVLSARAGERMAKLGCATIDDYLQRLQSAGEVGALVELLRVGETSFFRHKSHMKALEETVIPALREREHELRLWSAGCATGEEAYTLAMVMAQAVGASRRFSVLASDISQRSLEVARRAHYPRSAIASVPTRYRFGFEAAGDGELRVVEDIRRRVELESRNLSRGPYPRGFDLIFCRNVLIYFESAAKQEALRRLVASLVPGGFLFLGYSESLRDVEGLRQVSGGDAPVYRRSEASSTVPSRPPAAPRRASSRAESSSGRPPSHTDASSRRAPSGPAAAVPMAAPRPSRIVIELSGEYADTQRLGAEIKAALDQRPRRVLLDLDGVAYLGAEAAGVLRRAHSTARGMGIELSWRAHRAGPKRFLRRHGLDGGGSEE